MMEFSDDIMRDREPESSAFAGRFSAEKRLKDFLPPRFRYAVPIVANTNHNVLVSLFSRHLEYRHIAFVSVVVFPGHLGAGIERDVE